MGDNLVIENTHGQIEADVITVRDSDSGAAYRVMGHFSEIEKNMILAGGKISMIKGQE
jgi:hypothetical protein